MSHLVIHGAPQVSDAPEFLVEAADPLQRLSVAVNDVVNQIVSSGLIFAPPSHPLTICLLGTEHVYAALVTTDEGGEDSDLSWVPTFVESIKFGSDEVIRDVLYFGPQGGCVVVNAWNSVGDAVCGTVQFLPLPIPIPIPAFNAHGHMPKRADAPEVIDFCSAIGHHLWGAHWDLAVPEEDRC